MKLQIISDTHNQHENLGALRGEVLVHCGDMFNLFGGREQEIEDLDAWFGRQ